MGTTIKLERDTKKMHDYDDADRLYYDALEYSNDNIVPLLAKLPMTYDWWVYLSVGLVSILIAVIAGFFPAMLASKVNPVEGFRGNQGVA